MTLKKKVRLTRDELAALLVETASALRAGAGATVEVDGEDVPIFVPDVATFELKIEPTELEIEISWPGSEGIVEARRDATATPASPRPVEGSPADLALQR